jgi:hypothetical protein
MTRLPKTIPPNGNALPISSDKEAGEEKQDQAAVMEEQREVALEAWKMGRRLTASRRGLRTARIPRMHPGTWRSGR